MKRSYNIYDMFAVAFANQSIIAALILAEWIKPSWNFVAVMGISWLLCIVFSIVRDSNERPA